MPHPLSLISTQARASVSLLDVTPRKHAEQALLESEERYRALVENTQEGIVVSLDGTPMFISESMTAIFGYSVEELMRIHPEELIHPDDREKMMSVLGDRSSDRKVCRFTSFRIIAKDKRIKWLTMNIKPIMWCGRQAEIQILTDVTVFKEHEEELRTAHGKLEERVDQRTAELSKANAQLKVEAEHRKKAQEHTQSLTQRLLQMQENERQRISRDLHDNVAQDLSSMILQLETLFDDLPHAGKELAGRSKALTGILLEAISSVRNIAYGLTPPALDQLGLVRALENHCLDSCERVGIAVDFHATGIEEADLEFDTEINIYRMVQEAIRNIVKHAEASKVKVKLIESHPYILIRVEDNGQGFDIERRISESAREKRMGLQSMKERARLTGGSMEMQSLPGVGTRIVFKIPIEKSRRHSQNEYNDRR